MALETTAYTSRTEFIERFAATLRAGEEALALQDAVRVGVRYVNRIMGDAANDAFSLFANGMLGVFCPQFEDYTEIFASEIVLECEEGRVIARAAYAPPGISFDPGVIEPAEEKSWILDIDVFSSERRVFNSASLSETAKALAGRAYAVFRHVVSAEFLKRFGAP